MSTRKLVLVDTHALLYRVFFAIPALATSSGQPTNAVFGCIRTIRQVRRKIQPTHWLMVFDGGIPEERRQLLESYKAQRPPMPDDLRHQIPPVREYLDRALIPWICIDGQEADDVLATVATSAEKAGSKVFILTGDKDLYQLVDDNIKILPPSKIDQEIDIQGVHDKTGVDPAMIVQWLALTGDTSDNIPGVRGVGPKTAAKLLKQYGSIEGIWKELDTVTPDRIRIALDNSRADVARNVDLMRLRRDIDCVPDWQTMEVKPEDPEKLLPFFEELGLDSLAKEITKEGA